MWILFLLATGFWGDKLEKLELTHYFTSQQCEDKAKEMNSRRNTNQWYICGEGKW